VFTLVWVSKVLDFWECEVLGKKGKKEKLGGAAEQLSGASELLGGAKNHPALQLCGASPIPLRRATVQSFTHPL
jgi:hypothetical protein